MSRQILLPSLSAGMEEAMLVRWLKSEGDRVKDGDVIAEIETDKATMEFAATTNGIIGSILVPAGTQGVKVNQPIALLLDEEELATESDGTPAIGEPASPSEPVHPPNLVPAPPPRDLKTARGRAFASPLARRLATGEGIDLSLLKGSGPGGRIIRVDVERALAVRSSPSAPPVGGSATAGYREVPLSSMRKVIARRLAEAKQTIPHFYLSIDCTLDRLLAMRTEINTRKPEAKVSVNDFIVRAVALALVKVPAANASFTETAIRLYDDVDLAIAVSTEGGLITPVIRQADRKNLLAIAAETKALAARARAGKLLPEEYQGGGFTISNLGMYGITAFAAIINPPQACILAVGAAQQRIVAQQNAPAVATMMTNTLAVDHRAVDGALGAEFLVAYKVLIEDPLRLLL